MPARMQMRWIPAFREWNPGVVRGVMASSIHRTGMQRKRSNGFCSFSILAIGWGARISVGSGCHQRHSSNGCDAFAFHRKINFDSVEIIAKPTNLENADWHRIDQESSVGVRILRSRCRFLAKSDASRSPGHPFDERFRQSTGLRLDG